MADEPKVQHQALPPIANALQNMHCFLDRALASGARTIATGPLSQQAAHMKAVIGNVAEVERLYEAVESELQRLKPHQDFLALCRELLGEIRAIEQLSNAGQPLDLGGASGRLIDVVEEITEGRRSRPAFLLVAAFAVAAVQALDAAQPMEAANG